MRDRNRNPERSRFPKANQAATLRVATWRPDRGSPRPTGVTNTPMARSADVPAYRWKRQQNTSATDLLDTMSTWHACARSRPKLWVVWLPAPSVPRGCTRFQSTIPEVRQFTNLATLFPSTQLAVSPSPRNPAVNAARPYPPGAVRRPALPIDPSNDQSGSHSRPWPPRPLPDSDTRHGYRV